jgi:hypothetical protein
MMASSFFVAFDIRFALAISICHKRYKTSGAEKTRPLTTLLVRPTVAALSCPSANHSFLAVREDSTR